MSSCWQRDTIRKIRVSCSFCSLRKFNSIFQNLSNSKLMLSWLEVSTDPWLTQRCPEYPPITCKQPAKTLCAQKKKVNFSKSSRNPSPHDRHTLLELIKSCGKDKDLITAKLIHAEIMEKRIIPRDIFVSSSLICTYAKCGAPEKAQEVFDLLHVRDTVTWTALISAYSQRGLGLEALKCFKEMQDEGVEPDGVTYACILKSCGILGYLDLGIDIHAEVKKRGLLRKDIVLGAALVDMYAKCGSLIKAQEVFDKLPKRNVVSWTALIAGYSKHGLNDNALECFTQMQSEGVFPDAVTHICILKACGSVGCLKVCEEIDASVRKQGVLVENVMLGNTLVDAYAKCGVPEKAREVFELLPVRNVVTWNVLMAGYTEHGLGNETLECFNKMREEGTSPDSITYICVVKACTIIGSLQVGEEIYSEVRRQGLLQKDVILGGALVDMYAKCGALMKAREVFEQIPVKTVVSWTSLITGYAEHGQNDEALRCFRKMQDDGFSPDSTTYVCVLKACCFAGSLRVVEAIDAEVRTRGLLQKEFVLGTALVDTYAKCSAMEKAQEVFEQLPVRNVVTWTALIAGYAHQSFGEEALKCFQQMQVEGVSPNEVTYTCALKSCSIVGCLDIGEKIADQVRNQGLLRNNVVLGNALVDMYAKCGAMEKAQEVFEQLWMRDTVSWNVLIVGYVEHGFGDEALRCFERMQDAGASPDAVTYICILKACGILGSLEIGEDIHAKVRETGLLQDVVLGTALIDMYAKCGALDKAQETFNELPTQNVASRTALMTGYAQLGQADMVLVLFRRMTADISLKPDLVTFLVLLTACNHAGLLMEAEQLFRDMGSVYRLSPTIEHCTCIIDLFGREYRLDKAKLLIENVASLNNLSVYLLILGACYKWLDVSVGRWAYEQSVALDKTCGAAYICMEKIYAAAGMETEANNVELSRVENQAW